MRKYRACQPREKQRRLSRLVFQSPDKTPPSKTAPQQQWHGIRTLAIAIHYCLPYIRIARKASRTSSSSWQRTTAMGGEASGNGAAVRAELLSGIAAGMANVFSGKTVPSGIITAIPRRNCCNRAVAVITTTTCRLSTCREDCQVHGMLHIMVYLIAFD